MKNIEAKRILNTVRSQLKQGKKNPKYAKIKTRAQIFTKNAFAQIKKRAPEIAKKIKQYQDEHPEEVAIAIIVGGLTAIVLGKKMVIVGVTTCLTSLSAVALSLLTLRIDLALLSLTAVALGICVALAGTLFEILGVAAVAFGVSRFVRQLFRRLMQWLKSLRLNFAFPRSTEPAHS